MSETMSVDLRKFRYIPSWDGFWDCLECESFEEVVDMLPATREAAAAMLIEEVEFRADGLFADVDLWGTPEEVAFVESWDDLWDGWRDELRRGGDLWVIATAQGGREWINLSLRRVPLDELRRYVGF
jgi:hypothetical protein